MLALAQQLAPHVRPQHQVDNLQPQSSASPHDHNIDPAIAGSAMRGASPGESGGDDNGTASDSRKGGKRELSTSKRAAQNRAAQVSALKLIEFRVYVGLISSELSLRSIT